MIDLFQKIIVISNNPQTGTPWNFCRSVPPLSPNPVSRGGGGSWPLGRHLKKCFVRISNTSVLWYFQERSIALSAGYVVDSLVLSV